MLKLNQLSGFNIRRSVPIVGSSGGIAFSDDFNRADNDSLGANWTETVGDLDIASNKLVAVTTSGGCQAIYTATVTGTTQYVKATVGTTAGNKYYEIFLRYLDASSPIYGIELGASNDGNVYWVSYTTGVLGGGANLQSASLSFTTGDVIGVTVEGAANSTVIRVWKNPTGLPSAADNWNGDNTPDLTFTNDPGSGREADTGTYVGLGGSSSNSVVQWDDFFGGSL